MISAEYIASLNSYCVPMRECNRGLYKSELSMKFDTGAVFTVISLTSFTEGEVDKTVEDAIIKKYKDYGVKPRKLSAANGSSMLGYPVCVPVVQLGNEQF